MPRIVVRDPFIGRSAIAQRIAAGLLGYVLIVHAVNDSPSVVQRALGPARKIPRLKQSWEVMDKPWAFLMQLEIEFDLANGTTHQLMATDAHDGSFNTTLPQATSLQTNWGNSVWPAENSRIVEYRATMMLALQEGKRAAIKEFADFHRRK